MPAQLFLTPSRRSWSPTIAQRIEPPPSTTSTARAGSRSRAADQGVVLENLRGADRAGKAASAPPKAANIGATARTFAFVGVIAKVGGLEIHGNPNGREKRRGYGHGRRLSV